MLDDFDVPLYQYLILALFLAFAGFGVLLFLSLLYRVSRRDRLVVY